MQRALGRSTQSRRNGVLQGGNSSISGRAPEPEIILSSLKDKAEAAFLVMLDPQRFIICPGFLAERGENCRILLPFLLWQDHADLISSQSASSSSPSAPTLSKRQRKKMAKAIHQQNSFLPRDLSEWLPQGTVTSNDQDKNSRKKLKKKSKKTKKTSAGTKSETSSSKEVSGSSASATCGDSDLPNEGPYIEHELPEITQAENDTEGNSISRAKQPETPNTVVYHSDGVVASSSPVPSSVSEDFHSVDSRISATNEMDNRYSILSSFDEETAYPHESTDISSEVFFDACSAPFTEPFYDEWNSYESTNAGDDIEVQSSVREDYIINPSETSEYSKHGYFLDRPGSRGLSSGTLSHEGLDEKDKHLSENSSGVQNLSEARKNSCKKNHYIWREDQDDDVCEGISNSSDSSLLQLNEFPTVAECGNKGNKRSSWRRSSDLPPVLPIKSEQKDKNLSESSISARRLSLEGNVSSGPIGKENHLVRQKKVRKDDVVEGVSESSASSGLQFDSSLKEAPLSNRVSNVLGSEEVIKSKDDSKPKATDMPYKEALQHPVQVNQKVQRPLRRARLEDFTGRSQTRTIDPNAFLVRLERLQRTGYMEPLTISELAKWKDERKDLENVTETASHAIDGEASKPVGNLESSKDERSELDVCATVSPQVDYSDCERFVDSEIDKDERQNVTKTASHAIDSKDSKPVANLESSKDERNGLDVCATVSPQGDYNACDRVVDSEIDKDERKVLQYVTKTASHAIDRKDSKPVANLESSKDERSGLDVCATVSPQGDYNACDRVVDSNTFEQERNVLQALCTTVSDTNGKTSSSSTPEIADQNYSLSGLSERCSPIPVTDATINIQQIEDSCPESGNQGHISGSISKKRLPVPRQDASGETGKRTYENSLASVDKSVSGGLTLQKHGGKKLNPDAHVFVPLQSNNVRNVGKSSAIPIGRDRIPILKNPPLTDRVQNLQIEKLRILATDESDKIVQAVGDAYRTEMRSIGVHLATSKPLAEFETFLHSASPVLGPTRTPHECTSCSTDHFIGTSLCRHEIPDASLGRLWQWYEEHSSFGLEIKTEDYPKFSAYYVPSLSAVQLFGNFRSTSDCSRGSSRAKALKAVGEPKYDADLVKSSGLLPQPSGANASAADFSSPCSSSSVYGEDEFIDRSLGMTPLESELLFEYYELEQPFHRRPLFDKIKELVRGGGIQKCQTYGDPKKLESSNLQNLHPSSWYSVAWYPIYRIPQDDLKGAFLTFHSLGQFVRRCAPLDNRGGSTTSIVSPVVGLQSYNTQKESWFKLKPPLMTQTQGEISNHAEILEERLRSLQKTAYAMARAVVNKVDGNLITEHRDLKFFATRGGFK
ncbi:hypothetical protein MKX03_021749 [Papaver bracteatum]|nr:hypothetical protein MKX03_021749 [Papaver bracteatum]